MAGGVDIVQWREKRGKGMGYNRAYAALTAAVQERALLVVNGNWETAAGLGARRNSGRRRGRDPDGNPEPDEAVTRMGP